MKPVFLCYCWCGLALLAAAQPAPPALRPLDVQDLRDMQVPPAWAPLVRELVRPLDRVVLTAGDELVVDALTVPLRPGRDEDLAILRPMGDMPRRVRGSEVQSLLPFEDKVLASVRLLLEPGPPTRQDLDLAEKILRVALRCHRSLRCPPPLGKETPWADLQTRLEARLLEVRRGLLQLHLRQGEMSQALDLTNLWLPLLNVDNALREDIRALWVRHAEALVKSGEFKEARAWLHRLHEHYVHSPQADGVRKALRQHAEALVAEAKDLPPAQASGKLQEALALWPRLPGARDELEKRRGTYQVLRIAVRTLPEALSPATAWTDVEKQSLDLLFEGLAQAREHPVLGKSYRPILVDHLPDGDTQAQIRLRRDLFWSDGSRLTAADVRHSLQLCRQEGNAGRNSAARELLQEPRFEGDLFRLGLVYSQGAIDPLAALTFRVLPQQYRGRPLERSDDPTFAREPLGSGPYLYQGRKQENGVPVAVFRANAHHVRTGQAEMGSLREIHLLDWKDRLAELGASLPHLIWDVPTDQLANLRRQGYAELRKLPTPRVYFLAVNHRRPALAQSALRRALAHAIDRQALLERHFRASAASGEPQPHHSANGLFPRGSWASAATPRVPEELFHAEQVRSLLKPLKSELTSLELTLKYPDDDPRVAKSCVELAQKLEQRFAEGGIKLSLRPQAVAPAELRRALEQREYDLLYHAIDHADEPWRLWALFDQEAVQPGGSNYLGCNDTKLQSLLRSALQHRSFPALREIMQGVHVQLYEAMPLIPLWQLDTHVAVHPSLRLPALEALALFGDIVEWKLMP
jgi:peptide/nickel transport system substrate-binding protein